MRFAIIESNSGFVWGVVSADDALAACYVMDAEIGGRPDDGAYEAVSVGELRTTRGVYDVRVAPADFDVQDGQDPGAIAAVEALPRAGIYRWVSAGATVHLYRLSCPNDAIADAARESGLRYVRDTDYGADWRGTREQFERCLQLLPAWARRYASEIDVSH